jgi:hypothetical protein
VLLELGGANGWGPVVMDAAGLQSLLDQVSEIAAQHGAVVTKVWSNASLFRPATNRHGCL